MSINSLGLAENNDNEGLLFKQNRIDGKLDIFANYLSNRRAKGSLEWEILRLGAFTMEYLGGLFSEGSNPYYFGFFYK